MDWHRLLGVFLFDFFTDSVFEVELEKDLSTRKQMLDAAVIRRISGEFEGTLPDGLHDLLNHNLLTYKSAHEPLDDWALKELTGHYVNYRKQLTQQGEPLVDENEFRMYAIATRFPQKLVDQLQRAGHPGLEPIQQGVYNLVWGADRIRVIVTSGVTQAPHNAIWQLLSGIPEHVKYGAENYQFNRKNNSSVINSLFERYQMEGVDMPYTLEDFHRDYALEHLHELPADEVLKQFSVSERLNGLSWAEVEAHFKKSGEFSSANEVEVPADEVKCSPPAND